MMWMKQNTTMPLINTKKKIKGLLLKENPGKLKHDLALAPARLHDYIMKLLKEKDNDRMVETDR